MKKYISCAMLALACAACQPDDYTHPSEGGIPVVSDLADGDVTINVNQETNEVTFNLNKKGMMPVWIFDGKTYSTRNGISKIYAKKGTYQVELRLMNANGLSDGTIVREFTVDNTIVDYTKYTKMLAGSDSKQWMIARNEAAHMACGEPGSDGTGWWSANPNDKVDAGIYDDVVTFGQNYSYTYNPGEGGTVFVNKDCTLFPDYNTTGEDFQMPVSEQKVTYSFDGDEENLYLVLPANTLFPYIANDDAYKTPRYKVVSISTKKLELLIDNGNIAWHYTLVPADLVGGDGGSDVETVDKVGYKYDNDCNLLRDCKFNMFQFYAPGWAQIADAEVTQNGSAYTAKYPEATTDQWQAQLHFISQVATVASSNYDFSCVLNASNDHNNVTVKLVSTESDDVFFFAETVKLKALEDYVFVKTDMAGIDAAAVKVVFDFGGNAAGTEVTIDKMVLKEHGCDDGSIAVAPTPEADANWDQDGATNLWNAATFNMFFFYADAGWTQIGDPVMETVGKTYKLTFPTATVQQWQNQVHFQTDMATSVDKKYDFRCILNSTQDIKQATIKLVLAGDGNDGTFYFTERVDLNAYEDYTFKMVNMDGIDMDKVNLVFDFGGNPDNTDVTISGIILQEHQDGAATPATPTELDPASTCNLWNQVTDQKFFFYYAPGWAQIADPVCDHKNRSFTFALPEATSDMWQCQIHFLSDVPTSAAHNYDLQCKLTATNDIAQATVKLVKDGDDGVFYCDEKVALTAYEEYVLIKLNMLGQDIEKVKLVFDFGGNPAGTEVTVSDIVLKESDCE